MFFTSPQHKLENVGAILLWWGRRSWRCLIQKYIKRPLEFIKLSDKVLQKRIMCSIRANALHTSPPQTVTPFAHLHNPCALSSPPKTNESALRLIFPCLLSSVSAVRIIIFPPFTKKQTSNSRITLLCLLRCLSARIGGVCAAESRCGSP